MQQNEQTPLDYLNEIAPQAQKKAAFTWNIRNIIFAVLGVITLIVIISAVSGALSGAQKEPWQRIASKLSTTTTIVDGASANIKSSALRSINSDLKLYLTNTTRDLQTPMTALQINVKKLPASIVKEEQGTEIIQRLEDGRLNARYDSTYAREMTYQVATILSLLQKIYNSGVGEKTKETITAAYDNLLPTYKSLQAFTAANE